MSIKASLSCDGVEEVYTLPTLKEICLYKCLTNKEILTKEVEVDEDMDGSEKLDWEKFRLKEPIQGELVKPLLDAADEYFIIMTPKYESLLAAIRMSQPQDLVKVHVSNTSTLKDRQLGFLLSGGNVKSLDIHGCGSLSSDTLNAINKFGKKFEYLRIGNSYQVLPYSSDVEENSAILRTPNLKTFILRSFWVITNATHYWRRLLQEFISNLEKLDLSECAEFETLEFLEPAKCKLSSLNLSYCCVIPINTNGWRSLFEMNQLRSLDLVGSKIEEAFVGRNVVQLLLTTMPNLSRLAVDSGLVKDISVHTSIRGQGSVAKRLEFLGIMDIKKDESELIKAKLLAKDVAYCGAVEGELRILEYVSNQFTFNSSYFDHTLSFLLKSLRGKVPGPPLCKTVAVINLLITTFKNDVSNVDLHWSLLQMFKELLTTDVAPKLGNVLIDQCVEAILYVLRCYGDQWPFINGDVIEIMMNLDAELCFDHYENAVTEIMCMAEMKTKNLATLLKAGDLGMEDFKDLLNQVAQLLEKAFDRFPGKRNALWGISSVLVITKGLKDMMVSKVDERDRIDLVEIFRTMIASLRKLCSKSGPVRAAFHSGGGLGIVIDLLKGIIDGCLGLAHSDSFALLDVLKSILEDNKIDFSKEESVMIASGLGELLISVHSEWEGWESIHYFQMKIIAGLLNYLESNPRIDCNISGAVKEIMMKLT